MKKLKKLSIKIEKVIKNEELVNLKGGYDTYQCVTKCFKTNGDYSLVYTKSCCSSDVSSACSHIYNYNGASICVGCDC